LESLGVVLQVGGNWSGANGIIHKQKAQPEIKKQLVEAEAKEQKRKSILEERKGTIQQSKADQIGAKFELMGQRDC